MSHLFFLSAIDFWGAGVLSLFSSLAIVQTRRLHLPKTSRGHAGLEVQSAHIAPTPRVGGIALMLGLCFATIHAPGEAGVCLTYLFLSCLPVFAAGLMEDLNIGASPRLRLGAAMLSGVLVIAMTGYRIPAVGVPGVDQLIAFWPVGVLFTVVATAGLSHAFNLVDGLNGLSMGIGIVAAVALGVMAVGMGDTMTATIAAGVVFSVAGVLVVNYPFGRLFLGDGGAYTMGHLVGWLAVLLMARNPGISAWAVLMTAFWPVMDTGAAVLRRRMKNMPASEPDRLHYHHVVMRIIMAAVLTEKRMIVANSMATACMVPLFATPAVLAVLTATNDALALAAFALCVLLYLGTRIGLIRSFRAVKRRLVGVRRSLSALF
ncbi:MAG: glycosyltransferase [Pseudodonghicola sp.]